MNGTANRRKSKMFVPSLRCHVSIECNAMRIRVVFLILNCCMHFFVKSELRLNIKIEFRNDTNAQFGSEDESVAISIIIIIDALILYIFLYSISISQIYILSEFTLFAPRTPSACVHSDARIRICIISDVFTHINSSLAPLFFSVEQRDADGLLVYEKLNDLMKINKRRKNISYGKQNLCILLAPYDVAAV